MASRKYIVLLEVVLITALFVSACFEGSSAEGNRPSEKENQARATFAGGCFWCMQPAFDELDGVVSTTVGYTGGRTENPTYKEVCSGETGHAEAIQITYDPEKVSYRELLHVFWRNIDPTTPNRQFCDYGTQYRPAIFYHDEEQKRMAEASKREIEETKRFEGPVATEIAPLTEFYAAEDYHQEYYKKSPLEYKLYRTGCGRDRRLRELWGDSKK